MTALPPATETPFDRGMEGSEQAALRWTLDQVLAVDKAIRVVAERKQSFTADDVWAELGDEFPVTKGLSGRLKAAKNRGVLASTGDTAIASRGGSHDHGQRLAVWRSLVFRATEAGE